MKNDVPVALDRARARFPDVRFSASRALGVHPALAGIAFERAASVMPEGAEQRARTALVIFGRGSSDPDANGDFAKMARLIGVARPSVEETLENVARLRPERVVVAPYFLFAGRLLTKATR